MRDKEKDSSIRYWHGKQPKDTYRKPNSEEFSAFSNPTVRLTNVKLAVDNHQLGDNVRIQQSGELAGDLITGIDVDTEKIEQMFENSKNPKTRLLGMFHNLTLELGNKAAASDIYRIAYMQEHKGELASYLDWDVAGMMYAPHESDKIEQTLDLRAGLEKTNAKLAALQSSSGEDPNNEKLKQEIKAVRRVIVKIRQQLIALGIPKNEHTNDHDHLTPLTDEHIDDLNASLGTSADAIERGKQLKSDLDEVFANENQETLLGSGIEDLEDGQFNDILTGVQNNQNEIDELTDLALNHLMISYTSSPYALTKKANLTEADILFSMTDESFEKEQESIEEFIAKNSKDPNVDFEAEFQKLFRARRNKLLEIMKEAPLGRNSFSTFASYASNANTSKIAKGVMTFFLAGPDLYAKLNTKAGKEYGQIPKLHGEKSKVARTDKQKNKKISWH